jgi:hypothetical protein
VCDLENLKNEEVLTRVGSQRHNKKKVKKLGIFCRAKFTKRWTIAQIVVPKAEETEGQKYGVNI